MKMLEKKQKQCRKWMYWSSQRFVFGEWQLFLDISRIFAGITHVRNHKNQKIQSTLSLLLLLFKLNFFLSAIFISLFLLLLLLIIFNQMNDYWSFCVRYIFANWLFSIKSIVFVVQISHHHRYFENFWNEELYWTELNWWQNRFSIFRNSRIVVIFVI